jgi:RNA polymerase sigma-70 factor (ECF subfamily)
MAVRTSSVTVAPFMTGEREDPESPPLRGNAGTVRADRGALFAGLFDAHASFVWRVLRRMGIPAADADDAVQDVFLVVHRRLAEYEDRGSPRAWLFAISRQVASHRRRTRSRSERTRAELPMPDASPDDPYETAMRNEAVSIVHDFLAKLSEPQAMVFYLAEVEDMTAPEIATSLEVNVNTVYGRLRLARQQFEAFLVRRGVRSGVVPAAGDNASDKKRTR